MPHHTVGRIVAYALDAGLDLGELTLKVLRNFDARIDKDVFETLTLKGSMNKRLHLGGTATKTVLAAIKRHERLLK